jgi:cytoskeletal protein CcmA (bactofilin family)
MVDSVQSTIVGPSILINGNLQGDEDLTVLGRVEGTISLTKTLNVAESGIVKADISVRNAIVSGVVVGNITATDSVELTEAGRMVGDIRAPRVIIVDGARFRGAVDMGDLDAPRASGPLPTRTVDRSSLSRTATTSRPRPMPSRTPPPPPPSRPSPPPSRPSPPPSRPSPPPSRPSPPPSRPSPPPSRPIAQTEVSSPSQPKAPVAAKKKIKKKVVVKKKRV